jgi:SET domain-containing protein
MMLGESGCGMPGQARARSTGLAPGAFYVIQQLDQKMAQKGVKKRRWLVVRKSRIHGKGVFTLRKIAEGETIIQYRGEFIDDAEIERRYPEKLDGENHTFVFEVAPNVNMDGGVGGNSARYINHSCEGNCEAVEHNGRILIEALRDIEAGEELTYDYNIEAGEPVTPEVMKRWPCRCGARKCRGTVLVVPDKE